MKKVIICSGGGIRAAAFTVGAMQVIGTNDIEIMYGKSGSAWATYLIAKLGVQGAEEWMLKNMDNKRKVYDTGKLKFLWRYLTTDYLTSYTPLYDRFNDLRGYVDHLPWLAVSQGARDNYQYSGRSVAHVIASSSIDGVFPRILPEEGPLIDLAGEGLPLVEISEKREVIFINAYNDEFPRGETRIDRLIDQIERPLAKLSQRYADNLNHNTVVTGGVFRHIEITEKGVGIGDFSKAAITRCIQNGREVAREVMV